MSETVHIDNASAAQLRDYARNVLNIDVAQTENGASLRAKILAVQSDITEIPAGSANTAPTAVKPAVSIPPAPATDTAIPAGRAGQHFGRDPKVELVVLTASDPTRPKDVQIAVGGDVVLIQRGKRVSIPYRHYLALDAAVETVAQDSDEINPVTGLPKKEWVEQHSYPFQVYRMPSDEEIAAWEQRTASIEMA